MKKLLVPLLGLGALAGHFYYATQFAGNAPINDRFIYVDCARDSAEAGQFFLLPNCQGSYHFFEKEIGFHTNAFGLRDKDYPPNAKSGVIRIVVAGDSLSWGSGMEEKDTYPRILENRLNSLAAKRVEVINAADLAGNNRDFVSLMPRILEAYHPYLVLYQNHGGNEFADLALDSFVSGTGQREIFRADRYLPSGRFANRVSLYVNGFRLGWKVFRLRYKIWWINKIRGQDKAFAELSHQTSSNLKTVYDEISGSGAKVLVVSFNNPPRTRIWKPLFFRIFAPFLYFSPESEFPLSTLTESPEYKQLRRANLGATATDLLAKNYLLPDRTHLNEKGAQKVAEELAGQIAPLLKEIK
ncbi:MAG: SGNH/GDSL hydrolase family protein [Bdellovibrionota bacterium]